jgi:hypothetical protein
MPPPSIGRIVRYVISPDDVKTLNFLISRDRFPLGLSRPSAGDVLPLIITKTSDDVGDLINGQIILDGDGTLWRTNILGDESKTPGTWHWPEKF